MTNNCLSSPLLRLVTLNIERSSNYGLIYTTQKVIAITKQTVLFSRKFALKEIIQKILLYRHTSHFVNKAHITNNVYQFALSERG